MAFNYKKHTLSNGLRVIVHTDRTTPLVVMNILYDVGSKDENPEMTGFAHLFEHLMFGGSLNIPEYDTPLQNAGGENNAFTTQDITNYYLTLPKNNIEIAFWLESDRMLELAITEKSLDVQRKVVIEEYNQRYLNQPYGKVPILLQELAYTKHPYKWPTIGKDISHIANATLDEVRHFYKTFYNPGNAILVVAGDIDFEEVINLAEKWFGSISKKHNYIRNIPQEPIQKISRRSVIKDDVPMHQIIISFPMCKRTDVEFYKYDLLTDILSEGESSRLYQSLVKRKSIFSSVNAYVSSTLDEGQVIVSGFVLPEISIEKAEDFLWKELKKIFISGITENEVIKIKNKSESRQIFEKIGLLDKAMNLAYYELLGSADLFFSEQEKYNEVSREDIIECAKHLFKEKKSSTLIYQSKNLIV